MPLLPRENFHVAPAPPGVIPNYDMATSATNKHMYIDSVMTTLAIAFVLLVLRLSTKIAMKSRKLGWDDLLVLLAFLFSTARAICFIVDLEHFGIGHHVWDLSAYPTQLWLLHRIGDILYPPGILCAKVSVLMLYLSIFGLQKPFRIACHVMIGVNVAYLTATTLIQIFWCTPIPATFGIGLPTSCIDGYKTNLIIGALNLVTDLIVLLMPMPVLWKLQLSFIKKIGVAGCFSVGVITVATTIVREVEIATKLNDSDQTWLVMHEATWLSVELNMAIIASCLLISQHGVRHVIANTKVGQSISSLITSSKSSLKSSMKSSRNRSKSSHAESRFKEQSSAQDTKFGTESYVELRESSVERKNSQGSVPSIPSGFIRETKTFTAV